MALALICGSRGFELPWQARSSRSSRGFDTCPVFAGYRLANLGSNIDAAEIGTARECVRSSPTVRCLSS